MVTNIKLNDGKYIATFEICDNNEDYSICNLGQKLTNDVIQVNKTFIDIDIYKSQMEEKDQRIAELEQDLEFTTKTANELIEIKHKLEQELAELKENAIDRPKFKHFEEYWYIENNPYCDNELQVFNGKIMEIICAYDEDWLYEYRFDTSCRYIEEDNIFATEQEAKSKLKEMNL